MGARDEPIKNSRPDTASVPSPDASALVGTTLSGRYYLERLLGEGGMGAVYQAEHTHMRKRLAVKVLHPEMSRMPEVVARFEREAMAAAHIDHPNIAAATDFGKTEDGSFFLVLEFVEGTSLRDRINKTAPMPVGRALNITRQIASALQRAHSLGIVHRDLKPENVMLVERDGDPDFAKVLDFGIAKVPVNDLTGVSTTGQPVLTQLGMVYGTPEYMAPEQAAGQEVDARADLYSLGVIAYEMLCGVRPFDHESKVALMGMHVTAPVPRMAEMAPKVTVPPEVEALVQRVLEKESGRRLDDQQFLDDLDVLLQHYPPPAPTAPVASRSNPRASHNSSPVTPEPVHAPPASRQPSRPSRPVPTPAHTGAPLPVIAAVPTRRQPKVAAIVGGLALAAGIAGTVGVVMLSGTQTSNGQKTPRVDAAAAPVASTSASGEPQVNPPTPETTGSVDEAIARASKSLEAGNDAAVIAELGALAETYPNRMDVHRLLARAQAATGNTREAMKETEIWLKLDPPSASDPKLLEDVRAAAMGKEGNDIAFRLLEQHMGPKGIDVLHDFAWGKPSEQNPQLAARARAALGKADVRGRASPALQVALDLRAAGGCDAKKALLGRAREVGDARALGSLRPLRATKGCGFANAKDCWPCLRRDDTLAKTIAVIEERARR